MKMYLLKISLAFIVCAVFSGCATSPEARQTSSQNTVQSSGTTVSGYVDVGAGKKVH